MSSITKFDAVDIGNGKLTKIASNDQISFGKSRIDAKHLRSFVAKCNKDENAVLSALELIDDRKKTIKEKMI
jgi:hypothetical protein